MHRWYLGGGVTLWFTGGASFALSGVNGFEGDAEKKACLCANYRCKNDTLTRLSLHAIHTTKMHTREMNSTPQHEAPAMTAKWTAVLFHTHILQLTRRLRTETLPVPQTDSRPLLGYCAHSGLDLEESDCKAIRTIRNSCSAPTVSWLFFFFELLNFF